MTRTLNAGSILARLKNLQRDRYPNLPPKTMLQLYAQQGLLARLDASPYAERCVLKGAMSLFARYGNAARPTQDLDLATLDLPNTPEQIHGLTGGRREPWPPKATHVTTLRLDGDLERRLRHVAELKRLPYQTLLKQFVSGRLYKEEKRHHVV